MPPQLNHQTIQAIGNYSQITLDGLSPATAKTLHYQMLRLRRIEEALHREYHPAGMDSCPIQKWIGQRISLAG